VTGVLEAPARAPEKPGPGRRPGTGTAAETAALAGIADAAVGVALLVAASSLDGDRLLLATRAAAIGLLALALVLGVIRAGPSGALAWVGLTAVGLLVLAPGADSSADRPVLAALAGLTLVARAGGELPVLLVPGALAGRAGTATSGLLTSVVGGSVGVLVAISVAGALPDVDPRLAPLAPYAAAAGAVLAVAQLLAHRRAGAGFAATPALLAFGAAALGGVLVMQDTSYPVDDAVQSMLVASGVVALGLVAASATAAPPRAGVVVEHREAPSHVHGAGGPVALLALLAAAAHAAVVRPAWLDEASVARVTSAPFDGMLDATRTTDAHPPLFDVLSWLSQQAFGVGDLALRLPSVAAGVLLVPAVYLTARELYDQRAAVVAAVVAAVGPGVLWIAGAARPGAVAALLATLSLLAMLRSLRRGGALDWLLLALAGSALVWTHQLGVVHVLVLHVGVAATLVGCRRRGEPTARLAAGWAASLGVTAAAMVAVLGYRQGFGAPDVLPPLEYATSGAPGAGRSVLGLAGTALAALVGFHPPDVTSRLLALWPLCILATFAFFGRRWSQRGALLVALAAAPFVTLLVLQIAGAPRNPPFAIEWVAMSVPMLAIGVGRAVSLLPRERDVRLVGALAAVVLLVAAVDQSIRVDPIARFDVAPLISRATADAAAGDTIVYAPEVIGDLIHHEASGADAVPVTDPAAGSLQGSRRVIVIGAFGFERDDRSLPAVLALVDRLASERELVDEVEGEEMKGWVFG
jgi:hypothetical protein